MNSENFNKIQINHSINTKGGNLLINIREDSVEAAIELFEDISDMLKVNEQGEVEIILPHSSKYYRSNTPKNDDFPVIEDDEPLPGLKNTPKKTCKLCKAIMVLRNGKNGQFWGCSRYNGNGGCKYTETA